jgi:hypothetical protein
MELPWTSILQQRAVPCGKHTNPTDRSAKGVRVICTAGRLWLTVEGEAGDILLAPGDSHLIRGRGLALLEAIGRVGVSASSLLLAPLQGHLARSVTARHCSTVARHTRCRMCSRQVRA